MLNAEYRNLFTEIVDVKPSYGSEIGEVVKAAIKLATERDCAVRLTFNGTNLLIRKFDRPNQVMERYRLSAEALAGKPCCDGAVEQGAAVQPGALSRWCGFVPTWSKQYTVEELEAVLSQHEGRAIKLVEVSGMEEFPEWVEGAPVVRRCIQPGRCRNVTATCFGSETRKD